ncbi:carbohydrate ABC transporter permease [Streptococcus uberis]|uniref:carbohydrate ABC transporter permease n=1 Tax=Streptococcus uberis TaxID=1349 RepID=UPI003D36359D
MENQNQLTLQGILGKCLKWFLLLSISLFTAFPFIWMLISSLKTKAEVMNTEVIWPHIPQWGNYLEIFTQSPIPKYIWNSLWTSVVIVLIQIVTGAMLAYALVFLRFKGRQLIFAIVMGTYMLPAAATYIPSYIILSKGGMLNTLTGLIVSSTISIFGIFLLRQAFMQVPRSLIEASRMDGASHFRVLWEIVCPMAKSSFITFGLMSFIAAYNSYMWPSLITNDQPKYLVSQGLRSFFIEGGAYGTEWAKVMAASSVIVLPLLVIFAFTQKWFINGIGGDTGVKG